MELKYTLLIADRNPHVREFLKREMSEAGYRIILADTGRDVVMWTFQHNLLDLLILDPDLPDAEESDMLKKIFSRIPPLPVVMHTYALEDTNHRDLSCVSAFVEKRGNSIENLKQVVAKILEQAKPRAAVPAQHRRPSIELK